MTTLDALIPRGTLAPEDFSRTTVATESASQRHHGSMDVSLTSLDVDDIFQAVNAGDLSLTSLVAATGDQNCLLLDGARNPDS